MPSETKSSSINVPEGKPVDVIVKVFVSVVLILLAMDDQNNPPSLLRPMYVRSSSPSGSDAIQLMVRVDVMAVLLIGDVTVTVGVLAVRMIVSSRTPFLSNSNE